MYKHKVGGILYAGAPQFSNYDDVTIMAKLISEKTQ
jgi:hypothetical protein